MPQQQGARWQTTHRRGMSHQEAGARGGRPGLPALSAATREEIVLRARMGEHVRALAREYGLAHDTVGRWARAAEQEENDNG